VFFPVVSTQSTRVTEGQNYVFQDRASIAASRGKNRLYMCSRLNRIPKAANIRTVNLVVEHIVAMWTCSTTKFTVLICAFLHVCITLVHTVSQKVSQNIFSTSSTNVDESLLPRLLVNKDIHKLIH